MAEIEIGPLSNRFSDEEIAELAKRMEKLGAPPLPRTDERHAATIADDVDDDALSELMDRLDAHDLAADVYLPIEFEGVIEIADLRVASAAALLDALDEVKEELDADEDDLDEEYDDDDDEPSLEAEVRDAWRYVLDGANAALDKKLPLLIKQ
jgi:hypothetical protein